MDRIISGIALTHTGNFRDRNEDCVFWGPLNRDRDVVGQPAAYSVAAGATPLLAAVADGVGGCEAGEVASRMAIETICESLTANAESMPQVGDCSRAIALAHERIVAAFQADPAKDGMATTLTALLVNDAHALLMHVGDSRCYCYAGGHLEQVTSDDSPVGKLLEDGKITESEARLHPLRSYIDQVLGNAEGEIHPEVKALTLHPRERWLLCTDGLNESLYYGEIVELCKRFEHDDVAVLARALVDAALDRSGRDNISLVILEYGRSRTRRSLLGRLRRHLRGNA